MEFLNKNAKQSDASSTQKHVDVEEVRDGVIILRNGALRAVLLASSINFDLKSSEEQDAIILQYQNFLNTLDFPLQVIVYSRGFQIGPYIERLRQREKQQENELLKFQISEYETFVQSLTEVSNIMSKQFYIIVPFSPSESEGENVGFFEKLSGIFQPTQQTFLNREAFDTYRSQLFQRVDQVSAALSGTGVRTTLLDSEEVIELLYNTYNPSLATSKIIRNVGEVELSGR